MPTRDQKDGNRPLIEILDQEFDRLRSEGKGEFATHQDMAEFLRLDKAALSHYRSGERALTRRKAHQLAERLRDSVEERRELAERLFIAHPESAAAQIAVRDWFLRRGNSDYLMLVEFRELPAVRPLGEKAYLARDVAQAVADGLTYAMLLPFDPKSAGVQALEPVRAYIAKLQAHVIQTYGAILEHVLEHVAYSSQRSKPKQNGEELKKRLVAAASRLKLYVLKGSDGSGCPAIGYRLFYIEKRQPEGWEAERWEWISSGGGEQMIQKESSTEELEATRIRFFPIPDFWRRKGRLPETGAEMIDFSTDGDNRYYAESYNLQGSPRWEVYKEDRTTRAIVEDFLGKHRKDHKKRGHK